MNVLHIICAGIGIILGVTACELILHALNRLLSDG